MYKFGTSGPVSTTIATIAGTTGITSFTVSSAAGLPTLVAGDFATARIGDGTGSAENILITAIAGTTITCLATAVIHAAGAAIDFDTLTSGALVGLMDAAIAGTSENALTAAGALVSGSGATNRITLTSASATFTLANGTYKGELCRIVIDGASTKLATIDPAGSTTIDEALTRVMHHGESAILAWSGTQWEKRAGKSIPMVASMRLSASIGTTLDAVETTVPLNTLDADNTGLMVNTGANKITLQRTSDYLYNGNVQWVTGGSAIAPAQGLISVNAVLVAQHLQGAAASNYITNTPNKRAPGVAGQDVLLLYRQNSGTTTPSILGGLPCQTYLTVTEVIGW